MSTATFIKEDTTTQGTWYHGTTPVYGSDGCGIIGQGSGVTAWTITPTQGYFNYPAYATVSLSGESCYCYVDGTSDVRGLEYGPAGTSTGSDTKRVAAVWYSNPNPFTVDIQDGASHQIALYCVDWDTLDRNQTIQITDDNNGNAVLDTRTLSNFHNGAWVLWSISGKVTFTITHNAVQNAVVNGIFFDTLTANGPLKNLFVPRRFEPAWYE